MQFFHKMYQRIALVSHALYYCFYYGHAMRTFFLDIRVVFFLLLLFVTASVCRHGKAICV